jgi:hypothetical protein
MRQLSNALCRRVAVCLCAAGEGDLSRCATSRTHRFGPFSCGVAIGDRTIRGELAMRFRYHPANQGEELPRGVSVQPCSFAFYGWSERVSVRK